VCLDFINTLDPRAGPHPHDFLNTYTDLVRWGQHAAILSQPTAHQLLEIATHQSVDATMTFTYATTLREAMYRIFVAIVQHNRPTTRDINILNTAFCTAMTHAQVIATPDGFVLEWAKDTHHLDQMLWPVAQSGVDLLTSPELRRVKECPGLGDCGWLFLDTSKNDSRRWCSMEGCGTRAKMQRQAAKR
jgi:predicted RNA-binding Zn ribbon-like protein